MKKLLKNKKGESLVETLAAILIFTMASIALYSMVTTATGINIRVREKDRIVQAQLDVAERANKVDEAGTALVLPEGTVVMTMDINGSNRVLSSPRVQIFRQEESSELYSYFKP